jgi:hypothetical protein
VRSTSISWLEFTIIGYWFIPTLSFFSFYYKVVWSSIPLLHGLMYQVFIQPCHNVHIKIIFNRQLSPSVSYCHRFTIITSRTQYVSKNTILWLVSSMDEQPLNLKILWKIFIYFIKTYSLFCHSKRISKH